MRLSSDKKEETVKFWSFVNKMDWHSIADNFLSASIRFLEWLTSFSTKPYEIISFSISLIKLKGEDNWMQSLLRTKHKKRKTKFILYSNLKQINMSYKNSENNFQNLIFLILILPPNSTKTKKKTIFARRSHTITWINFNKFSFAFSVYQSKPSSTILS